MRVLSLLVRSRSRALVLGEMAPRHRGVISAEEGGLDPVLEALTRVLRSMSVAIQGAARPAQGLWIPYRRAVGSLSFGSSPKLRHLLRASLISCAVAGFAVARTQTGGVADSLREEIDSLRVRARYTEAAEIARVLLGRLREDTCGKPYQVADAERLISTLRLAAALPESSRAELAEADRLRARMEVAFERGDYAAAENLARRHLAMLQKHLVRTHPEVTWSICRLAIFLDYSGKNSEAEPLYREALTLQRQVLGPDHPDIAETLNEFACFLKSKGDFNRAEAQAREGLAMRRRLFGANHTDVAESLNDLGLIRFEQAEYAEAESLTRGLPHRGP